MRKLNLIMPMGGGGTRFGNRGFRVPKPLIELYGKPFFYWSTRSIEKFVDLESLTFVVLKEHIEKFNIDREILKYYPKADIHVIPEVLPGAVLTCLEGVKNINNDMPVLFNDCDHLFLSDQFYAFCRSGQFESIDAGLLTFCSDVDKFSYVSYDENGYVNGTVEKKVVSNDAICGAYYFKDKETFISAVDIYLKNCAYQEFFVSGVYNILAEQGKKIQTFDVECHVPFGTPEEYDIAQKDTTYFRLDA